MMLRAAAFVLPLSMVACSDGAVTAAAPAKTAAVKAPASAPEPPSDELRVTGKVIETMDAGPYTYVHLKTENDEIWAAVNEAKLKTGSEVTIGNAIWMEKFESKTLNRKFDRVLFGSILDGGAAALPPGHPAVAGAAPSPAGAAPGAPEVLDAKVERASGSDARTVAEIYASKASLKGREVVVRGRVVKFNAEILGRNWIHLRDGSGSSPTQDNDITVTTTDRVTKGDIVTVRGKVALDRDFTAGYAYPVMIEDARVVK